RVGDLPGPPREASTMVDSSADPTGTVTESGGAASPDTGAIVAALAARAKLGITPAEHQRLSEYVVDSWEMADRLRDVPTPGHEGHRDDLPLRAAYSNLPPQLGAGEFRVAAAGAGTARDRDGAAAPEKVPLVVLAGDLVSAAARIAAGEFSPLDLTAAHLNRIERYDGAVRSYITVDREGSLAEAAALSAELSGSGPRSLLHGVPFGA